MLTVEFDIPKDVDLGFIGRNCFGVPNQRKQLRWAMMLAIGRVKLDILI
jgi:hypothetical protein